MQVVRTCDKTTDKWVKLNRRGYPVPYLRGGLKGSNPLRNVGNFVMFIFSVPF